MKKPNLNGPRFRNKRISVLTHKTLTALKEKYPKYKDLSYADFKKIITSFNKKLTEEVIANRNGIELPEGLGFIFMGVCPKPKTTNNIDFKTSTDTGINRQFKNWDSDNKLLKIFYSNYNVKFPFQNKQVWAFKAVKQFRHEASKAFKENWQKYIEVESGIKISMLFDKYRKKEYLKNLKINIPENYNELEI